MTILKLDGVKRFASTAEDIFDYEKPALLVIDMQKGFIYPGHAFSTPAAYDLIPPIRMLLEYFRENKLPVIYTEFVYSNHCPCLNGRLFPCEKDIPDGGERCCFEGDDSVETIDELKPLPGELVIRKYGYDAFAGTSLDYCLRTQGIRTLVMVGILTDECLFASVSGAFHHEYDAVVASDCTVSLSDPRRDVILEVIDKGYGSVYTAGDILKILEAKKNP